MQEISHLHLVNACITTSSSMPNSHSMNPTIGLHNHSNHQFTTLPSLTPNHIGHPLRMASSCTTHPPVKKGSPPPPAKRRRQCALTPFPAPTEKLAHTVTVHCPPCHSAPPLPPPAFPRALCRRAGTQGQCEMDMDGTISTVKGAHHTHPIPTLPNPAAQRPARAGQDRIANERQQFGLPP